MPSSIGIYIGTESVEVVHLGGGFSRPNLINSGSVTLSSQSAWRDLLRMEGPVGPEQSSSSSSSTKDSYEAVVSAVRSVLSRLGISAPKAHVAVALESVVVRYFQMPAIPVHERRAAIAFEAKKYLPFKLEELVTDYQTIFRRSDPTLMRVMFFGIKRTALMAYDSLFQAASVTPLSLEPASIGLVRLVRQNGQISPGQVCVVLSVERDTATISVARDDLLYLSRNVTILSAAEAAEWPSNELLDALVTETRVSVDYYRRRFLGEPTVGKVILFGKGIDPKRIAEFSHTLEIPVEIGQPFRRIAGAKSAPEGLWAATGLALRGLQRRGGGINLLSPEQRAGTRDFLKLVLLEGITVLIVLGIWFGVSLTDLQGLQQQIASVRASAVLPAGVDPSSTNPQLKEMQDSLSKQARFLKTVAPQEAPASKLLYEISTLLPSEAWLNWTALVESLEPQEELGSHRRRIFQLQGSAFSGNRDAELEKINTFLAKLRENPFSKAIFSHFSLDSVQSGKFQSQNTTDFALTCATRPEDASLRPPRGGRPRSWPHHLRQ